MRSDARTCTIVINSKSRPAFCLAAAIEAANSESARVLVCVAHDGSGDYSKVIEAVNKMPNCHAVIAPKSYTNLYTQRTFAATQVETPWITFLDDDDGIDTNTLDHHLRRCGYTPNFFRYAPRVMRYQPGFVAAEVFFFNHRPGDWLTSWNSIFPTKLYSTLVGRDDSLIRKQEDQVRWLRGLRAVDTVEILAPGWITFNARRHSSHISTSERPEANKIVDEELITTYRYMRSRLSPLSPISCFSNY